jgi:hypothetical protein
MNHDRLERALANLELPEYSGIRDMFGTVLQMRSTAPEPDCAWFNMLADRTHMAERINKLCASYVDLVSADDARKKAEADLLGVAMQSPHGGFQNWLGDFYAEPAAVVALSRLGYHRFRAKLAPSKGRTRAKAYDYDAWLDGLPVCIEVKNLRPPRTLVNVFFDEVRRLAASDAEHYPFNLVIRYAYDHNVTLDQEELVLSYLASLRGRTAPFADDVLFPDGTKAQVTARPGACVAMRLTSRGINDPYSFNVEALLNKIREKAQRAVGQMSTAVGLKVLVLNINTPWAELDLSHVQAAEEIIRQTSGGSLRPYFMHYHELIQLDAVNGSGD